MSTQTSSGTITVTDPRSVAFLREIYDNARRIWKHEKRRRRMARKRRRGWA
jgi:hypothetical protein